MSFLIRLNLAALCCALAACGQVGPLYLHGNEPHKHSVKDELRKPKAPPASTTPATPPATTPAPADNTP